MKYLFITVVLLLACSKPTESEKEYTLFYVIPGEGLIESAFYYNPETGDSDEWDYTQVSSPTLIGLPGQTLWIQADCIGCFQVVINVDDEYVAESESGESIYVEYVLP